MLGNLRRGSNEKPPTQTHTRTGIIPCPPSHPSFNPHIYTLYIMSIRKIPHSGAIEVSDIVRGYLVQRVYFGFTRKQAIQAFKIENATK